MAALLTYPLPTCAGCGRRMADGDPTCGPNMWHAHEWCCRHRVDWDCPECYRHQPTESCRECGHQGEYT